MLLLCASMQWISNRRHSLLQALNCNLSYKIKAKNHYRDIHVEQNTVNDNKVQKGKCAGFSVWLMIFVGKPVQYIFVRQHCFQCALLLFTKRDYILFLSFSWVFKLYSIVGELDYAYWNNSGQLRGQLLRKRKLLKFPSE